MLKKLMTIIVALAILALVLVVLTYATSDQFGQFGGKPSGKRLTRIQQSPAFRDGKLQNPPEFGPPHQMDYWRMLKHQFLGKEVRVPPHELPIVPLDRYSFGSAAEGLQVIWLGHSTAILEIEGRRILTDPVWSERCSPSSIIGPERWHAPPIPIDQLPPLDAVLISHDHYDHLDMHAIQSLASMRVSFIVPLGIGAHLEKWGVEPRRIHELDWWEADSTTVDGLSIVATPARHFSGRLGMSNNTLWASFAILGAEHRVYFSGDGGPFPGFAEIGEKYGPFDLTMIKIGAYAEDWPDIHLNPEQAAAAHKAVRGNVLLPIHWGTFNLAYHNWDEPIEWLLRDAQAESVQLLTPMPGERVDLDHPTPNKTWWRQE